MNFLAIQPVQQFSYTQGKNSTDIVMVIETMDLLYAGKYDTFVLISSDSDFTSLASRLRTSEMYVYGVGEKKTPIAFRNACDDFVFTENLSKLENKFLENDQCNNDRIDSIDIGDAYKSEDQVLENNQHDKNETTEDKINDQEINNIISLLSIACETYSDEDGWTNVSSAGTYIKRTIPDFDSRNFGFPKLPELIANFGDLFTMKKYKGKGTVNIIAYKKKV